MGDQRTIGVVLWTLALGHLCVVVLCVSVRSLSLEGTTQNVIKEKSKKNKAIGCCVFRVRTLPWTLSPFSRIFAITSSSVEVPNSFSSSCLEAASSLPWAPCLFYDGVLVSFSPR